MPVTFSAVSTLLGVKRRMSTSSSSAADVRALVRDHAKATCRPKSILRRKTCSTSTTYAAFSGVSTLFLLDAVVPDEFTQALLALCVAREACVKHVVYLSIIHRNVYVPHLAGKFELERMIEAAGVKGNVLRPA